MFQFSLRSLFAVLTALAFIMAMPALLPWLSHPVQMVVVVLVFLSAWTGCALMSFVLLLAFCIAVTPDERDTRTTNLRRCLALLLICLLAMGPLVSIGIHAAFGDPTRRSTVADF